MSERTPDRPPPPEWIGRRRFLTWAWRVLGAGLAASAGWTAYDVLVPRAGPGFGGQVAAGAEGAFPEGRVRYFPAGRFYLTRVEGELVALYQRCPHLGCRVPFCESSGRFECPCHGSIFNLKGEYLAGPSPRGLDRFPLEVTQEGVVVDTGTPIEGPAPGRVTIPSDPQGPSCLREAVPLHEDMPDDEMPHEEMPAHEEGEHGG